MNAVTIQPNAAVPVADRGFTLIELLTVVAVVGVLSALAIPSVLRARITVNETSAIASLRAISNAQVGYSSSAGSGGYAATLATLALPCVTGSRGFISADLASDPSTKSGYRLAMQAAAAAAVGPADCNGTPTHTDFYSTGVPVAPGITGSRGFASNARGTVFFDPSGVPPGEPAMAPGGGAQPVQ